jgi:hypothetical protein
MITKRQWGRFCELIREMKSRGYTVYNNGRRVKFAEADRIVCEPLLSDGVDVKTTNIVYTREVSIEPHLTLDRLYDKVKVTMLLSEFSKSYLSRELRNEIYSAVNERGKNAS